MGLRDDIMNAIKDAMRAKDQERLGTLRLMKAAVLMLEKSGKGEVSDEDIVAALRTEIKKRQQTLELLREHNKADETAAVEREIAVVEEFVPQQLSMDDLLDRVRAYAADHPEIDNAGKLTGAMKKELGDLADGRMLNQACRQVLEG